MTSEKVPVKRHLFYETSHSPSLVDMVGYDQAKDIIDFCYIANPYYPTLPMMRDLQKKLPLLIKSYPSSNPRHSQVHLAKVLRVNPDHLVIGNGASELIAFIEETLVENIGIPIPTFSEYLEKLRDARAAKLFQLPPDKNYRLNLSEYLDWIRRERLRSALVINPGNPTGQFIPLPEILGFLEKTRGLDLVIVDESFIDFAGDPIPSLLPHVETFPHLLIVRSMSKHCGVPGLRLGYCCTANQKILRHLRRVIPVWNINSLAEYFLSLLPPTDKDYHRARKRLMSEVRALYDDLKGIPGFFTYPTGCNFLLLRIENGMTAAELQMELLQKHRLYVRDCSNKAGMDDRHIRVASQGRAKDVKLVRALEKTAQKRLMSV
jgi:histidinol-phosphate/aromatic aminotransferase/cobyric acid decarboxylase-like protein